MDRKAPLRQPVKPNPRLISRVFGHTHTLILAIGDYIDRHNESPKPFIWTAKATDILEKVTRAKAALNK